MILFHIIDAILKVRLLFKISQVVAVYDKKGFCENNCLFDIR